MDADPNFRLKAFAVIACVLGVFFVAYVAQRTWFWLKSRSREDVETSRLTPIIDFGLLAIGGFVIWMAIEALVLAVITSDLPVQSESRQKIAEIEIGKLDQQTGQLNLLFFPVDRAGRRIAEQRRPVLTSGTGFELRVEILRWRSTWTWLGEGGFYQFVSLSGRDRSGVLTPATTRLGSKNVPRSMGSMVFLRVPQPADISQPRDPDEPPCVEGEIYDIYLEPDGSGMIVELHPQE